jgi:hypothetical protein
MKNILKLMEAEGGIEPPYTALQAVNLRLFLRLISRLHRKSGNPLMKPTPRRQTPIPHASVLNSTDQFDGCLLELMLMQILEYHANRLFPNFQRIALFTFVAPQ